MKRCCQELTVWRVACPHPIFSVSPPFPFSQEQLPSLRAPGPQCLSSNCCRAESKEPQQRRVRGPVSESPCLSP